MYLNLSTMISFFKKIDTITNYELIYRLEWAINLCALTPDDSVNLGNVRILKAEIANLKSELNNRLIRASPVQHDEPVRNINMSSTPAPEPLSPDHPAVTALLPTPRLEPLWDNYVWAPASSSTAPMPVAAPPVF